MEQGVPDVNNNNANGEYASFLQQIGRCATEQQRLVGCRSPSIPAATTVLEEVPSSAALACYRFSSFSLTFVLLILNRPINCGDHHRPKRARCALMMATGIGQSRALKFENCIWHKICNRRDAFDTKSRRNYRWTLPQGLSSRYFYRHNDVPYSEHFGACFQAVRKLEPQWSC